MCLRFVLIVLASLLAAIPFVAACADDGADEVPPICTDRPTKSNSPCTVPAGMWQLETDIGNFTRDERAGDGTDTLYMLNPYLKYGLGAHTDIEVNWAPMILDRTTGDGKRRVTRGMGDLYVRLKSNFYSGDVLSVSVIPFVKAPTASHGIGNGQWEGGVAMPMSVAIKGGFTLLLGPELDALADVDGRGHHVAVTNLFNLSHALTGKLSIAVEYWRQDNPDPSGHIKQESGDVALIYAVNAALQLDFGSNTGLDKATPNEQVYFGLSYRW
jgi:hypothetical protein